jgi:hypothetical protein
LPKVPGRENLIVTEVCAVLRRDPATLRRWRQRGIGPSYIRTETGHILYPRKALEEYLAKLTQAMS